MEDARWRGGQPREAGEVALKKVAAPPVGLLGELWPPSTRGCADGVNVL